MDSLVYKSVPSSDHFLNISVEIQSQSSVIASICHINDTLIPLEQGIIEKVKKFDTF